MAFSYILFDLDGTLLDTAEGVIKAVQYTAATHGMEEKTESEIRSYIGPPIYDTFQIHYGLSQEESAHATEIFRNAYKDEFLFYATVYDGMYELLDDLKLSGRKLGVATNKRQDYTEKLLAHFDMMDRFDCICGSDMDNKLTKTDIINICLDRLGCDDKSKAVMIGDTIHDKNGAEKVGIEFIGVSYGFGFKDVTDECLMAKNVKELKNYIFI